MSDGPTVEGSIVAKLGVNKDQASADLREFKAQVDALDAKHPEIRVSAETSEAAAKLDQLKASEAELTAETDASTAAFKRYVPAIDEVESSTSRANVAQDASGGYMGVILAAVAALLPLLGPLAAEGVAVGASFIGMGASGVLAIEGIKKEMAEGTALGLQYSAGVQGIKKDLDQLENTAAHQLLGAFDAVVKETTQHLPQLNQDVGLLTDSLSHAGGSVVKAFLDGLAVMTPLVDQADKAVEGLASDFDNWSSGSGLQAFVNYAIKEVPIAEQNLGDLGAGVVNFVADLAPLGNVILGVLGGAGRILSFFSSLGPVLPLVAGGALAGYAAFKLWGTVPALLGGVEAAMGALDAAQHALFGATQEEIAQSEIYTALLATEPGVLEAVAAGEDVAAASATGLGAAIDFATGPIGIAVAVLGALATATAIGASATTDNTQAVNDYTEAVSADNGVIGQNIKLTAAKKLQEEGAYTSATKLGIATNTLLDATLGDAKAKKVVNAELDKQKAKLDAATKGADQNAGGAVRMTAAQRALGNQIDNISSSMDSNGASIKAQIKAYNDLQHSIGGTTITSYAQLQVQKNLADEYGTSVSAYEGAIASNKQTADQAKATTLSLQLENDAATLLTNAFTILNGGTLDAAQAQTGLYAANNTLTQSFKQNGKAIDGSSTAAVANQQALEGQVSAAQAAAEAIGKQTGSSKAAIKSYEDSKVAIEAQLKAQGDLTPAVQAYIDKLYDVKNLKVPPTKLDVDDANALRKLADFKAHVLAVTGSSAVQLGTIKLGQSTGRAGGGFVDGPGTSTSDSVLLAASRKEFVVKASSAQQYPGFMKAYNENPSAALASVGGGTTVHITNKTGVNLADLIDVRIEKNNQSQRVNVSTGVQRAAR